MASSSGSPCGRKQLAKEIDDFSEIGDCEHESINLHGVLKNLSPVKKGRRASYFEGQ